MLDEVCLLRGDVLVCENGVLICSRLLKSHIPEAHPLLSSYNHHYPWNTKYHRRNQLGCRCGVQCRRQSFNGIVSHCLFCPEIYLTEFLSTPACCYSSSLLPCTQLCMHLLMLSLCLVCIASCWVTDMFWFT